MERQMLEEESKCSICLQELRDAVTLSCGHNFCYGCVTRFWEERRRAPRCVLCNKLVRGKLTVNNQLCNLVHLTSELMENHPNNEIQMLEARVNTKIDNLEDKLAVQGTVLKQQGAMLQRVSEDSEEKSSMLLNMFHKLEVLDAKLDDLKKSV